MTINYRLNVPGFFASNETYAKYGTTGNWGLLDQIEALEWIRDNISAFGGDPGRVTIGGESAGSYSVSALLLSPRAKGLFHGAVMESGSILSVAANSYYGKGDLRRTIEVCGMMSWLLGACDDVAGLETMRAADAHVLAQLAPMDADYMRTPAFFFFPVYDGNVLPVDLLEALRKGDYNKVPLLYGYNSDEGALFVPDGKTEEEYAMLVTRTFGGGKAGSILERFPVDAEHSPTRRARQVLSYGMFSPGMKVIGDALAGEGLDVYAYYFDYVSEETAGEGAGANHAAELPFVFNNLGEGASQVERRLAEEMHLRWANFIKNGDPNVGEDPPSGTNWPKYTSTGAEMIRFDVDVERIAMPERADMEYMQYVMYGDEPYYYVEKTDEPPSGTKGGGCSGGAVMLIGLLVLFYLGGSRERC